jgi:asparagine synthase (glutamine-hydrolysing)
MCGFVAVLTSRSSFPESLLSSMRDRIRHRGPHGAKNWIETYPNGTVALGFRRLAVIDPRSIADQPMVSVDSRKVLVFNGEIYNYIELRNELEERGRVFRTRSDTEVLLQAYEEWGEESINRLNGMFAFLIWDELKKEALVVRDRFGEKPLFYTRLSDGTLIFGSEIKAILANPDVPCNLDFDILNQLMLGTIFYGRRETPFERIWQFPPGSKVVIKLDGRMPDPQVYWQPHYVNRVNGWGRSPLIKEFREHLIQSFSIHTRSDVKVTASLSGGLDSSILVGVLAKLNQSGLGKLDRTLSVSFPDDPTLDESAFINMVLKDTNIQGELISPNPDELIRDLQRIHWHYETIIPGVSMYLEWCIMRLARQLGYTVLLDGQGADEILAGYQIYFWAFHYDAHHSGRHWEAWTNCFLRDRRVWQEAKKYDQAHRRFSLKDSLSEENLGSFWKTFIDPMMVQYDTSYLPRPCEGSVLPFMLGLHLMLLSLQSNLFFGDRNSMAHSVECRHPYLDYDLVDFCSTLPRWAYIDRGWQKMILRLAGEKIVPNRVRWRVDKVGFSGPQDKWLQRGKIKEWVEDRIFDPSLLDIQSYDRGTVEHLWVEHKKGISDMSESCWRWASVAEFLALQTSQVWRRGL